MLKMLTLDSGEQVSTRSEGVRGLITNSSRNTRPTMQIPTYMSASCSSSWHASCWRSVVHTSPRADIVPSEGSTLTEWPADQVSTNVILYSIPTECIKRYDWSDLLRGIECVQTCAFEKCWLFLAVLHFHALTWQELLSRCA